MFAAHLEFRVQPKSWSKSKQWSKKLRAISSEVWTKTNLPLTRRFCKNLRNRSALYSISCAGTTKRTTLWARSTNRHLSEWVAILVIGNQWGILSISPLRPARSKSQSIQVKTTDILSVVSVCVLLCRRSITSQRLIWELLIVFQCLISAKNTSKPKVRVPLSCWLKR